MCPIVLKSGSLKLLEPSGTVQACNGIVLHFLWHTIEQNEVEGFGFVAQAEETKHSCKL
jgi:hypothetical protein